MVNRKGFTVMEAILSMYILSILIAIGMSLIQFTTKTNFSEMKMSKARSELSQHILFIQRDFQSADWIFISDGEYRDNDGNLLDNKDGASSEIKRLFIGDKNNKNRVNGIDKSEFVSYRIEKNFNNKTTTLYYDGDKNYFWEDAGSELISEVDIDGLEKYLCPTDSNRVKDSKGRPIGAFVASLVFYEEGQEDLNKLSRYNSTGGIYGYGREEVDYNFENFSYDNLDWFRKTKTARYGVDTTSDMVEDEIVEELKSKGVYHNFKQLNLDLMLEKYTGAIAGSKVELVLTNRGNNSILKCKVIDRP